MSLLATDRTLSPFFPLLLHARFRRGRSIGLWRIVGVGLVRLVVDFDHIALAIMLCLTLLTILAGSDLFNLIKDIVGKLLHACFLVLQELVEDIPT